MAEAKTNAMRMLESLGIAYTAHTYEADGFMDGVTVAGKIGQPPEKVYKTLAAQGASREYYVFVVPVKMELDLKAAAKAVGEKSVEMIPVGDITRVTGYIRGGCSPVGMKKAYKTVVDLSCIEHDTIIFSGGRIGIQIEMAPDDLQKAIGCEIDSIAR